MAGDNLPTQWNGQGTWNLLRNFFKGFLQVIGVSSAKIQWGSGECEFAAAETVSKTTIVNHALGVVPTGVQLTARSGARGSKVYAEIIAVSSTQISFCAVDELGAPGAGVKLPVYWEVKA